MTESSKKVSREEVIKILANSPVLLHPDFENILSLALDHENKNVYPLPHHVVSVICGRLGDSYDPSWSVENTNRLMVGRIHDHSGGISKGFVMGSHVH